MRPLGYVRPTTNWNHWVPSELRVMTGGKGATEPYTDEDLGDLMFGRSVSNLLPSRTTPADLPAGTPYSELARMVRAELLRDFSPPAHVT